jgi:protein TonB
MTSYRGAAGGRDRAKAIAGVAANHAGLAANLLIGQKVRTVTRPVEQLTTNDLHQPPPPPPVPPPTPAPKPQAMKHPAGAPAATADPPPVVAPPPRLPLPSPIPAAKVAGSASASTSGASTSGSGTGAGGSGTGRGGGGSGDYSGFTPARLISNIPNVEYAHLASTGLPSGLVGVTILVGRDGSLSNCRIARSSGDPSIDRLVCELTLRYVRFAPARDADGRPVAQDITYFPNWRRRF